MSTVTPPPPVVAALPSGLVSNSALVLSAPSQVLQALQTLQTGQTLQASITAQPATNQVQVQTSLGTLTLQTALNLPRDAVLSLVRVPAPASAQSAATGITQGTSQAGTTQAGTAPPIAFQISAVNGKPVAANGPQLLSPGSAQGTSHVAPPPLAAGQTVTATLLRPVTISSPATATTGATPGAATSPGQTASQATSQTAPQSASQATSQATSQTATPASATQAGVARTLPGTPTVGQSTAQTTAQTTPATGATNQATSQATTTLPSGTRFSATVQRVEAPNPAVTTPTAGGTAQAGAKSLATGMTPGQVLTGTVTGRAAGGQPIVQTPTATFALGSGGAVGGLGEGAKITFRLDSAPLAPSAPSPAAALRAASSTHALINTKSWDDLAEALKALAGADPARLTQVTQHTLPQPGAKLTSQMLFFLSALKGGDLKGLFGDSTLRIIDKERPGLTSRLGSDLQTMSRLADEPLQGDWRLALIPLWNGEKLDQLRFFWRGGSEEEEGDEGNETRFVFDVDFSHVGRMQIDGLVKAKRRHVDLIIRTDQPLPAEMRTHIGEIFEDARDTLNVGGQVAFQAAPGNFVDVPSEGTTGPQVHPQTEPTGTMVGEHSNLLA